MIYRADSTPANLAGLYRGCALFLVLNGPSAQSIDYSALARRGRITMAVNNGWSMFRPNLWACLDSHAIFSDGGWRDPGIVKFSPLHGRNSRLLTRIGRGFAVSNLSPGDAPASYFYRPTTEFEPDTYLDGDMVAIGTPGNRPDSLGIAGARSVMLAAVRIAHHLGFARLYLLGADFAMTSDRPYAFHQPAVAYEVRHCNAMYRFLNMRFAVLRPLLEQSGMSVWNCTPESGLTAFDCITLDDAIERERELDADADGWLHAHRTLAKPTITRAEKLARRARRRAMTA